MSMRIQCLCSRIVGQSVIQVWRKWETWRCHRNSWPGITDMVRISDARMSGTAYGTVVLHVCPEAAAGGVLALVKDGDVIELDVEARRLHLDVSDEELARRRAAWNPILSP